MSQFDANVGKVFSAWDGHTYFCDSFEPDLGYWMTRTDCPPEHRKDTYGQWRRNVSWRAIGRTFHEVLAPVTDWPNVETDTQAWKDWAAAGKPEDKDGP